MKKYFKHLLGGLLGAALSVAIYILLRPKLGVSLDSNGDKQFLEKENPESIKIIDEPEKEMKKTKPVQTKASAPKTEKKDKKVEGKININQADVKKLCELPLIGESKAEGIVAFRKEHGDFSSIDKLVDVPGVSARILEKLSELITV